VRLELDDGFTPSPVGLFARGRVAAHGATLLGTGSADEAAWAANGTDCVVSRRHPMLSAAVVVTIGRPHSGHGGGSFGEAWTRRLQPGQQAWVME